MHGTTVNVSFLIIFLITAAVQAALTTVYLMTTVLYLNTQITTLINALTSGFEHVILAKTRHVF